MAGTEKSLNSDALVDRGEEHHKAGRLQEAESHYRQALEIDPGHPGALYYLASIAYSDDRLPLARQLLEELLCNEPKDAEAWYLLGMVALKKQSFSLSVECLNKALLIQPTYMQAHLSLGDVLSTQGRLDAALINYNKAIEIKPDEVVAYINRGNTLTRLKRLDEALLSYETALSLKPNSALVHINRGYALIALKRLDEAIVSCDRALALNPDDANAYFIRGNALKEILKLDAAREDFTKALKLKPDYYQARWVLGLVDIPAIYRSECEIQASREAFERALHDLDIWFDESRVKDVEEEAVAAALPFHLAYQEENNKELLSCYGRLTRRLMAQWQSERAINPAKLANSGKIKVGVVSSHVRGHSVWDAIAKGWLLNFDSSKFEWHIFSLSSRSNEKTELIRRKASFFIENAGSLNDWASSIVASQIEVLIYPEIGMDQQTARLANLRLAPLQIATWGHPETTGLETIDYYLSADLLEPGDADSNYTESLIKLPNLGCTYTPHQVIPSDLNLPMLGINNEFPILLCPGNTFKYSPKYDGIFPQIAHRLGPCTFVFFDKAPYLTAILKQRLKAAFEKEGLIMESYIKFIPWLSREDFYGLMRAADVFMDTIGFSGFNTAIQAIECSLPVVTIDGRFMRGKLASGILKRLGLNELICDSEKAYCDVVVRLVKDEEFKNQVVSKIDTRQTILYNDLEPLRALEKFLLDKCRYTS